MHTSAPRIFGLIVAWAAFGAGLASADESWQVEVRETAGIERFGYPMCGEFQARSDAEGTFELRSGTQVIPAQCTRLEASANDTARWSVDFALDLAPLETRRLQIVRVEEQADQSNSRRLTVEERDAATIVRHPSLAFTVPNNLQGLIESIDVSGDEFVAPGGAGFVACLADGSEIPLVFSDTDGTPKAPKIVKSGPLAVALTYEGQFALPGEASLRSQVTLKFPLGKSWVCVDWSLDQIPRELAGIGADVRLRLVAQKQHPVLADVGAGGWTYAALKPDEALVYLAEPPGVVAKHVWSVDRIVGKVAKPYALPSESGVSPAPQGWAHLLDASRCTAIAMDHFATHSRDSMRLSAEGLVQLRRKFVPDAEASTQATRHLKFWLHVVRSPAQIGAATNPQSMQSPPEVRIVPWQSADAAGE